MLCNKCNQPLPDDSEFCQYCGAKLESLLEGEEILKTDDNTAMESSEESDLTPDSNSQGTTESTEANGILADAKKTDVSENDNRYSLKGTETGISVKDAGKVGKAIASRDAKALAKYAENGVISTEFYNQLIETYGVIPKNEENHISDNTTNKRNKKKRFCKMCGGLIDRESKKCTSCGKQYFKLPKPSKRMILPTVICSVLIGAIIFLSIMFAQCYSTMTFQRKLIKEQKSEITSLKKDVSTYKKQASDNKGKADFMDDYIVLIGEKNNKYHKYGCADFDGTFHAYNINAAKSKGYRACSKCN